MAKEEKNSAEKYREERKARLAKAAKKNQKAYNPQAGKIAGKVIAVILAVAIVAGIGAFALSRTGALVKNKVAFKVGDVEVTQPEYAYYYASSSNQIIEYLKNYGNYIGISYDSTVTPDKQQYTANIQALGYPTMDLKEGESATWTDYFEFFAKKQIRQIKGLVKLANEKNVTLDESDLKTIDKNLESMQESLDSSAASTGISYSVNGYFREYYGKGVNEKLVKEIMKDQSLASKYLDVMDKEIEASYTDKQVEKEYNKNIDSYAAISYRSYKFTAETVKDEKAGTESATKETLAAAKKDAEAFKAAVTDEDSFKKLAAENEKKAENKDYKLMISDDTKTLTADATKETVSSSQSDEKFLKWAFSSDTKKGDTYLLEGTDGCTVFMMVYPMHKAPDNVTYDVRHILVKFPGADADASDSEGSEEETTTAAGAESSEEETTEAETTTAAAKTEKKEEDVKVETLDTSKYTDIGVYLDVNADTAKDKATYKKAQDILQKYLDGEHTAEAFEALQNEYSEDNRDESTNELKFLVYQNTAKGDMVPQFESWSLEKGRKEGDVGIVETTYGYHIMYFVKTTTTTWADTVRHALSEPKLTEIQTKAAEGDDTAINAENEASLADVEEFIVKVFKSQIRNSNKSSSAG